MQESYRNDAEGAWSSLTSNNNYSALRNEANFNGSMPASIPTREAARYLFADMLVSRLEITVGCWIGRIKLCIYKSEI